MIKYLVIVFFLIGCGWYVDDNYDGYTSYDYDPSVFEQCRTLCFIMCDNCYSYDYSVNACMRDCEPECRYWSCYKDRHLKPDCNRVFQELCNGQYE
jgi:hypothetical protein